MKTLHSEAWKGEGHRRRHPVNGPTIIFLAENVSPGDTLVLASRLVTRVKGLTAL